MLDHEIAAIYNFDLEKEKFHIEIISTFYGWKKIKAQSKCFT